jgi:hypothetical protein
MDGVLIVLALLLGVIISACAIAYKERKFEPPVTDEQDNVVVNGVVLGKYYGDPETKTCVEVIAVEDDMVAFRHMSEEIHSMPKSAFLEKYYKYPNGCEFPEIDRY